MPSPIGHALAGVAVARIEKAPVSGRFVLTCAVLAAAPDLDLVFPPIHRSATHSVTAAAIVFIVAAGLTEQVTRWRTATVYALAYGSHLLLDWLGADTRPPFGIEALWPFSHRWFISGADIFPETARRHLLSAPTLLQNLRAVGMEVLILLPIVCLVWLASIARPHRR
jgi:membrane-bound metal-dependent hydrolase YbcI (DUF457 family)